MAASALWARQARHPPRRGRAGEAVHSHSKVGVFLECCVGWFGCPTRSQKLLVSNTCILARVPKTSNSSAHANARHGIHPSSLRILRLRCHHEPSEIKVLLMLISFPVSPSPNPLSHHRNRPLYSRSTVSALLESLPELALQGPLSLRPGMISYIS